MSSANTVRYRTGSLMFRIENRTFKKQEIIIHPGDYYCSNEDIVISTILGSCISVVLYDETKKQGGLNHFLLPQIGLSSTASVMENKSSRYGITAMEVLINDLMKLGSSKSNLMAKVFGGAAMFGPSNQEFGVGSLNIKFAFQFLEKEGIRILSSDTGQDVGRKIFFFPKTGQVLLKKIHSQRTLEDIKKQDEGFKQTILEKPGENKIVLF